MMSIFYDGLVVSVLWGEYGNNSYPAVFVRYLDDKADNKYDEPYCLAKLKSGTIKTQQIPSEPPAKKSQTSGTSLRPPATIKVRNELGTYIHVM